MSISSSCSYSTYARFPHHRRAPEAFQIGSMGEMAQGGREGMKSEVKKSAFGIQGVWKSDERPSSKRWKGVEAPGDETLAPNDDREKKSWGGAPQKGSVSKNRSQPPDRPGLGRLPLRLGSLRNVHFGDIRKCKRVSLQSGRLAVTMVACCKRGAIGSIITRLLVTGIGFRYLVHMYMHMQDHVYNICKEAPQNSTAAYNRQLEIYLGPAFIAVQVPSTCQVPALVKSAVLLPLMYPNRKNSGCPWLCRRKVCAGRPSP